jgi:uncharacterized membrane protein
MTIGQAARRAPRWMLLLLIASLAVNFLFLGLAGGAMWKFRGPPPMAGVTPNLLGYASTLPSDRRKSLLDQIEAERQHLRPFRREVRAAREETIQALVAEPSIKRRSSRRRTSRARPSSARARPCGTCMPRSPPA